MTPVPLSRIALAASFVECPAPTSTMRAGRKRRMSE
jgi:hypothetical protein